MNFYILFDTVLGRCAIAWRQPVGREEEAAVIGFQLPEATDALTSERITAKTGASKARGTPARIREIIRRVGLHFNGEVQDFRGVVLDLEGAGSFAQQIYAAARAIPSGQTLTYGQLAEAAGHPGAARAAGRAMGSNPIPLIIPCHRVVAAGRKPGGFSAHGGLATKAAMLKAEGIALPFSKVRATS